MPSSNFYYNLDSAAPEEHRYTLRDVAEGLGYDIGLSDYPLFDEGYRGHLNRGIYDHFAMREIATETPADFIFYLNRRMRENMPTYNAMYQRIARDDFDPFATTSTQGTASNTSDTASANTSESSNASTATNSSTPASYLESPEGVQYMDSLGKNTGSASGKDSGTSSTKGSSHYSTSTVGTDWGTAFAGAIDSAFLNVDVAVYNMLEPCFMQVWTDANR